MARTIAQIQTTMLAEKALHTELDGLTSTSQAAIWRLWIYIVAVSINLFEQVMDIFKTDIETQIASAAVGSDSWVQAKMFEMQYSTTIPQVIQLNNYAPFYDPVNEDLRIISRCSVKTATSKTVNVKVATGEPPAALDALQLAAAQGYLSNTGSTSTNGKGIGFAGVAYNVTSLAPDLVIVSGDLSYDGQYSSTIQQAVIDAITEYFANIEFDGNFVINKLIDYIQAVPGVLDFTPDDIAIRPDSIPYPGYVYICQNKQVITPSYALTAGYCIGETEPGFNIGDNIVFNAN